MRLAERSVRWLGAKLGWCIAMAFVPVLLVSYLRASYRRWRWYRYCRRGLINWFAGRPAPELPKMFQSKS